MPLPIGFGSIVAIGDSGLGPPVSLEPGDVSARPVMNGEHVNFVSTYDPVDKAIGPQNNFADGWIDVFGNDSTRLWKVLKTVYRVDDAADRDACVVRRVSLNERANRGQVGLRALGPVQDRHPRKRFLTSS